MSISVVIPYYNNINDIERCLKSVMSQTIIPDEVLLIDDCSRDSSLLTEIIKKYEVELKLQYFRNDSNKNGAYSRNLGVLKANSEYIAFLDADDYWGSEHLETALTFLVNSNSDLVYSNMFKLEGGLTSPIKVTDLNDLNNPCDIILFSPPQTGSFFFRKVMKGGVVFNEKLRRHQDYQFLVDSILAGNKILYNDVYTSYYCVHPHLLSRKLDFNSIFYFWNRYKNNFSEKPLQKYLIRMLCLSLREKKDSKISKYKDEFEVLDVIDKTMFFKIYKIIGDRSKFSRMMLFVYFKIRYDSDRIIGKLIRLK